jgi:hypothetical protein
MAVPSVALEVLTRVVTCLLLHEDAGSGGNSRKFLRLTCQSLRLVVNNFVSTVSIPVHRSIPEAQLSQWASTGDAYVGWLKVFPNLRNLTLPSNIAIVQSVMRACSNITCLSFSDNGAVGPMFSVLANHTNLKALQLRNFPTPQVELLSLSSVTSLQRLWLSVSPEGNQHIDVSLASLSTLTLLTALRLLVGSPTTAQAAHKMRACLALTKFQRLKELQLELDHLDHMDCLGELTNLTLLTVDGGGATNQSDGKLQMPDTLGQLVLLEKLRWRIPSPHTLTKLPGSLCALNKLRELSVKSLQDCEIVAQLTSLQDLTLYHARGNLPAGIGSLQALTSLNMSASFHLTTLPSSVSCLRVLQQLVISNCVRLRMLPAVISSLSLCNTHWDGAAA